ncbi:MarR family transcriptional regulator [Mangrovicoccus algicola]|uniref:MarR family transcriptional regulator n=1 Tax=Mangrovicoccus algicola TaxID=2771008 RepID=A0A8J7CVW1_9RHOB|nr:MarR family transcriptional regulator [Mangrovicoccus algicola]MBE3636942.1 MarR family transcriptional regulator [Mangrovicoccus algicola]
MNVIAPIFGGTSDSLHMRINRARERVVAPIRAFAARSHLTEQQWRILTVLEEQGPMDATRLSEQCGLLLPSQTRIIQTLMEKALVSRCRDLRDRRRQTLAITDAGRAVVSDHAEDLAMLSARIESRLGRKRLATLIELLDELERI